MDGQGSKYDYKAYNRELTEQFIHGLHGESMISENLRKVSLMEDINDVTSKRKLPWVQRVEAQRVQKEALDSIKEVKEFDSI